MFCQKCGRQIPDGSVICNYCGTVQQPQTFQPIQPTQPVQFAAPPPAPKKKNNTVLIAIIAALVTIVLVVVAIFVINPLIEKNNSNSSQSEIEDDDNEDKDSDEKEEDSEDDQAKDEENALIQEEKAATAALEEKLNYLYSPDSDECINFLNGGALSADDEKYFAFYKSVLYYYDYEITGCEKDGDSYIFTVDIETLDFCSLVDELNDLTEEVINDDELVEEMQSYTDEQMEEFFISMLVYLIDEGCADKATVTTEIEIVCDEDGNWTLADSECVLEAISNNLSDAMDSYAGS